MMISLLAGINVYAANYTLGTVLDFDNNILSTLPTGVHLQEDGYYGNVLNWDTRAVTVDIDFTDVDTETLITGKHILSFDVKQAEDKDKIAFYFLDYDTTSQKFKQKLAFEQRLGNFVFSPNNGTNYVSVSGGEWVVGEWNRYDMVFDYTNETATLFKNGQECGTISLAADAVNTDAPASSTGLEINGFNKMRVSGTTHDAGGDVDTCFDNLCYRPYSDETYQATISGSGDELVIKFDETTANLTTDNFTVIKKASPLSAEEAVTDFTIAESCGAYTVIKLNEEMTAGERYFVTLNNVQSLFENSPAATKLEYFYDETEVTGFEDDLSGYTTDNFWTATGPWKTTGSELQAAINYTTVSDGIVTLTGADDGQKLLRYDVSKLDLNEGIIEIEANMSVSHNCVLPDGESLSKTMAFFRFQDQRNESFTIGEFQLNGLMTPYAKKESSTTLKTIKDNALTFGTEAFNKVKVIFDMDTKLASVYLNNSSIIENVYPWRNTTYLASDITSISIINFTTGSTHTLSDKVTTVSCNAVVNIDSIKVTKTVYNTAVSDISFTDVYGKSSGADNVSSATNKIIVTYPSGMLNNEFNGTVVVNDGTENISGEGVYDSETGIYTFTADKLLGANKTYTLTLSDSVAANGSVYKTISGTFVTGNAIRDIEIASSQKTESGAEVILNAVNTGEAQSCYVITAGYKNGALAKCYLESLSVGVELTEYTKTFAYNDSVFADCDYIKAFIWNDISQTLMPIEN